MRIVVDSCVICQDFRMKRDMAELLDFVKNTGATLVVPRIVREECVKKYRDRLREAQRDQKRVEGKLANIDLQHLSRGILDDEQIEAQVQNYSNWLNGTLMRETFTEDAEYSHYHVEELVSYALTHTKPGGDTVHLKDLMVWKAVQESCGLGLRTCFITSDKHFASGKRDETLLHEELAAGLRNIARPIDQPLLFDSVASFLDSERPRYNGIDIEWLSNQAVCAIAIDKINEEIFVHERESALERKGALGPITYASVRSLVTKPRYVIAKETDSAVDITAWFESTYNVQCYNINTLSELRVHPLSLGEVQRSILSTAWMTKIGDQISLKHYSIPFDW
ncbi:MAG: PIN domain-containing protein [candidate division Zixibacteria bacterium]|nr:PIN domain-containing protein [candidate division Zixibacteria bacterium]